MRLNEILEADKTPRYPVLKIFYVNSGTSLITTEVLSLIAKGFKKVEKRLGIRLVNVKQTNLHHGVDVYFEMISPSNYPPAITEDPELTGFTVKAGMMSSLFKFQQIMHVVFVFVPMPVKLHHDGQVMLKIREENASLSGISDKLSCNEIRIYGCEDISSHVLDLIRVPNLQMVTSVLMDPPQWMIIINKHLRGDRDLLDCQEELRTAGLRQYGKL